MRNYNCSLSYNFFRHFMGIFINLGISAMVNDPVDPCHSPALAYEKDLPVDWGPGPGDKERCRVFCHPDNNEAV